MNPSVARHATVTLLFVGYWTIMQQKALGFADIVSIEVRDRAAGSRTSAKRICDALSKQLISESGPMGLGVFTRSRCKIDNGQQNQSQEKVTKGLIWRLRVDQSSEKIVITLSLSVESKETNQASLNLSGFNSASELVAALEDPQLAWLVGIGLLDQLPVMGRANERIKSNNEERYSVSSENESEKVGIKLSYNLVPVRIAFQPNSGLWNVTAIKGTDTTSPRNSTAPVWLANNRGRSENQEEIVERIEEVIEARKQEAKRRAEAAAEQAAAEARKREESQLTFPRLPTLPGSYWTNLNFAWSRIPNTQLLGLNSRLMIGTEADYFRWFEVYGQFDRVVFTAEYISTADETTEKSTQLVLTESTAGIGTSGRFDLSHSTWMRGGSYLNYRKQSVVSASGIPNDFDFQNLEQDNLFGFLLTGTLESLNGPLLSGVEIELEALVPQLDEYRRLAAEVSSLFLLTRTPGSGKSEASTDASSIDFRLGPFFRSDFQFIKRTFPARATQTETSSASIKIQLINFQLGITMYVAF